MVKPQQHPISSAMLHRFRISKMKRPILFGLPRILPPAMIAQKGHSTAHSDMRQVEWWNESSMFVHDDMFIIYIEHIPHSCSQLSHRTYQFYFPLYRKHACIVRNRIANQILDSYIWSLNKSYHYGLDVCVRTLPMSGLHGSIGLDVDMYAMLLIAKMYTYGKYRDGTCVSIACKGWWPNQNCILVFVILM